MITECHFLRALPFQAVRIAPFRILLQVIAGTGLILTGDSPAFAVPDAKKPPLRDDKVLRKVADGVLAQTTRRLHDQATGETYTDSTSLEARPSVTVESKFNAWYYQTWLLADGMRRVGDTLGDPRYQNYGEQNLDFLYRHLPYFKRQHAAGMKAAPNGDGKLSPVECYFQIRELWQTGLAPLVEERFQATKDVKYEEFLRRIDGFLAQETRFEDGTFYRAHKGLMTDDPYMVVPYLVRKWKHTGESRFLDSAIQQIMGTHKRVLDPQKRLLSHLWDLKTETASGMFWARGNGWTVLAHAELLAAMPTDHPRRTEVLAAYVRHMEGIVKVQDPEGGWHQVLDHPESWIETSGTGMLTYGIARGVNEGWLDQSYAHSAVRGWEALEKKTTDEGDVLDVCASTDVGDLNFYLNRPRKTGDLHGFGSILLAGAEVSRLVRSGLHRLPAR